MNLILGLMILCLSVGFVAGWVCSQIYWQKTEDVVEGRSLDG